MSTFARKIGGRISTRLGRRQRPGPEEINMARRLTRAFFVASEVLFVGYSRKHEAFCKAVYDAFEKSGARVYPVNPNGGSGAVAVFDSLDKVPARPEFAYVLTNKETTAKLVDDLAARGVRRVLFNSTMSVDKATLARCAELGLKAEVACPMMALGGGFHKFHGFLAGVRA
jgi:predicted CoA-binding protein